MDNMELLQQIFELCIVPLLGILTAYIVKLVQNKYLDMLNNTIAECVVATNQTYVWALKQQNAFDKEAQKQALEMTRDRVIEILNDEAKEYLSEAYGDLEQYILTKIESTVNTEANVMEVLKK